MREHPWLYWTPRALAVLICLLLASFALDAFTPGKTLLERIGDFLVHLLPAAILAALVALAWRRPALGAAVFLAAGTLYAAAAWSHTSWILLISGPMWLIGVLFAVDYRAVAPRKAA